MQETRRSGRRPLPRGRRCPTDRCSAGLAILHVAACPACGFGLGQGAGSFRVGRVLGLGGGHRRCLQPGSLSGSGCRRSGGLGLALGLGSFGFGMALGLGSFGFGVASSFGGLELGTGGGLRLASGFGGRGGLRLAACLGGLELGACRGFDLAPRGLRLGRHASLFLEPGCLRFGGRGDLGLASCLGSLELGERRGLGLAPRGFCCGGFGRLGLASRLGSFDFGECRRFRLAPGGLGFRLGGRGGLGLALRLRCLGGSRRLRRFASLRLVVAQEIGRRPGQRVERRELVVTVRSRRVPVGDVGDQRAAGGRDRGMAPACISWPKCGAHDRQRPSASFQQLPHVYWRQDMQKLKVLWNASSCCDVASRSVSLRAAAKASSIDVSSDMTKFLRPRETTLSPLRLGDLRVRGFERVAGTATFAE